MWNQSAMVSRAERKAVSPEVMGQAITPIMASTPPTGPSRVVEIWYTTSPAPPAAMALVRPVMPSSREPWLV